MIKRSVAPVDGQLAHFALRRSEAEQPLLRGEVHTYEAPARRFEDLACLDSEDSTQATKIENT